MVDGPVSSRRFSRRQVRSLLMIGVGVIVALAVVIGGWQVYSSISESASEKSRQQRREFVEQQAIQIAEPFKKIDAQLGSLAGDASILALFRAAEEGQLASAAIKHQGQFNSALKLRLILPGRYQLDNESVPPLSYGSLDLLRRAETSNENIAAEAHLLGSANEHIVMVKRVKNDAGDLLGLIHLSLSVQLLEQAVAPLELGDAYLELQQAAPGKALLLGKNGNAASRAGEPVNTPVAGTRWVAAVWTSGGVPGTGASVSGFSMIVLVLVLVVLLAAGGSAARVMKKQKSGVESEDSEIVYAGAVRAFMEGAHPGMEKMVPDLPKAEGGNRVAPQAVSQGAVGDDITMIMKKKDLKAAAADSEMLDITQPGPNAEAPAAAAPATSAPAAATDTPPAPTPDSDGQISSEIFRSYDIRGVVGKTITADVVSKIGQAIGSEAGARGQSAICVGRDGRTSSPELAEALIDGLRNSGRDVIDIGVVPTPVLYYATHFLEVNSGVMLTGSHNGPTYNGLKIVLGGETLSEDGIRALYTRVVENNYESGQGSVQSKDIIADYIRRIADDIPVALGGAYKIVVDCGNGVAGAVAPQLFRALGHDVVELYCEVDGNFPNHHPDPSQPENLQPMIDRVREEQANLGFAFDGDGDRLGVVDELGNIIWPDRQLMLLAKDVLSRNQGMPVIFDVKCSRYLKAIIESSGGQALMWKTGHSLIKNKMKEVNAPLAGEMSGHIFFKERWYGFDDALYTAARLLEVLMNAKALPSETFAQMPEGVSTPELRIDLPESAHQSFMTDLEAKMTFEGAEVIDIDGYRVEFPDGWGLIRPSNTTPCLVLRFEAENQSSLERIQEEFRSRLLSINSDLQLPF